MNASSSSAVPSKTKSPKSPESFDSLRRRNTAAEVLQSYEKLSWLSTSRCESIVQTRAHFQRIVAGFGDLTPDDIKWNEDFTPHPGSKPSKKGKERASLGGSMSGPSDTGGSGKKDKGKSRQRGSTESGSHEDARTQAQQQPNNGASRG
ncbi:hypothetical protein CLAFUW4_00310 [Fulvia fulva]|uniref:Uncharacterized protein n=1 Tax=Passalora fulva TaxID=5499 RepID=A0A9Q8P2T4_PASFU|nr:uncharacterized protein CLAFUR5_00310 [Fulvia fulva]KAK4636023.1 hypothetical protein CLAFUR4_00310 [Fulvia fulva]KAK4638612.1 hypothetical protein CLAFUR0_00311 [Fulvia fulva]UJO11280.1 hypothetical protein CLAFUR5_00310 [Fulvia fulva]WPV09034.1 hypothetical protein CLAFUW4_00310 [Fulvia fulva]WPV24150.1 hypothetical protein CLAFUW7_00314 [Fulvia fulva]